MGLIEIEIDRNEFVLLATFLVRQSAIPDPTFEVLGDDRLVRSFDCANVSLGEIAPDLAPPPGVVAAKIDVSIGHASVAELEADADAHTIANAVAWVYLSLKPMPWKQDLVQKAGDYAVIADLIRLDIPGRPVTERFDSPASRRGRVLLGAIPIPLPDIFDDIPISGSAVVLSANAATLRVGTGGQDMFTPPAERLFEMGKKWLLRVSPEVFTGLLNKALVDSVTPTPPGGAELIEAPTVTWAPTGIAWPGGPPGSEKLYGWGANGHYRLTKHRACGDEDVSVTVYTTLLPIPDYAHSKLTLYLEISASADDGATFQCWLSNFGVATLSAFFAFPLIAIGAGLASFAIVGNQIDEGVGEGVKGQDAKKGFTAIGGGDNFAIYSMDVDLGLGALGQAGAEMEYGLAREDGVVYAGTMNLVTIALITHVTAFDPDNGSILQGVWAGGFSCSTGWHAAFELPRIHITDQVTVQGKQRVFDKEVIIFADTSWVVPPTHWKINSSPTVVDQYASIVGDEWVYTGDGVPARPFPPPAAGHAFLQTSAGLRRFEIGHVPRPPEPPTERQLVALKANCERLVSPQQDIHWLIDGPVFDYGHDPLRHWVVTIDDLPAQTELGIHGLRNGAETQRLAYVKADRTQALTIELVTDNETELRIEHDAHRPLQHVRISQQWLLPTTTALLGGRASDLRRAGDRVEVRSAATILTVSSGRVQERGISSVPPGSIALPDGRIAAVHGNHLILAYAIGGSAVHAPVPISQRNTREFAPRPLAGGIAPESDSG